jgi:hypothetical protein
MNNKQGFCKAHKVALVVLGLALMGALAGCVGYVDGPRVAVFAPVDDYVYYPGYEVYYSSSRHQYAYREGNAWVARSAPRGVSVNVLLASPSVRMNFHDSPANHHADVVRQYPRSWSPQGGNQGHKDDHHDNH